MDFVGTGREGGVDRGDTAERIRDVTSQISEFGNPRNSEVKGGKLFTD